MATFQLIDDCTDPVAPAQTPAAIVPVHRDPWGADLDRVNRPLPTTESLALGEALVNSPEYRQANLPAYQQSGRGFLDYFLL